MRYILLLLLFPAMLQAQNDEQFKIYEEATDSGFIVYADNSNPYPMSARINFRLTNLKNQHENNKIYVVPANTKKLQLTELNKVNERAAFGLSMGVSYNFGDHYKSTYDTNYVYHLPYDSGQSYLIDQGYFGRSSHFTDKALDFSMKVGTPIRAIREGIVMEVIEKHNRHCPSKACLQYNNFITVYQPDGTFCEYVHLKQNGAIVEVGDTIKQNQIIGYSGNTGYTSGPHLHLMVYLQRLNKRESVATKFKVGTGKEVIFLEEKKKYRRAY